MFFLFLQNKMFIIFYKLKIFQKIFLFLKMFTTNLALLFLAKLFFTINFYAFNIIFTILNYYHQTLNEMQYLKHSCVCKIWKICQPYSLEKLGP